MNRAAFRPFLTVISVLLLTHAGRLTAEPAPAAVSAFRSYTATVEARLAQQHGSPASYLAVPGVPDAPVRLRRGELLIEHLTPQGGQEPVGALLHDWRGTAFAPGAHAADFLRLMQDFDGYPQRFAPQVVQAKLLGRSGDRLQATMRVRQRHVITVAMDTAYDITYGQLDARHGYSISRSTRIDEIDGAGTPKERALAASEEHGFLWRLNTYWSYEERDGGLYLQVEAVSLTRTVPVGLGWVVRPYVESIPRESLEFTLRATVAGLRR